MLSAQSIATCLKRIITDYPDCVLDITGGSDAALFSAGRVCAGLDIPVFTYSRKQNSFYNIINASFLHALECTLSLDTESSFLMAGGAVRTGRVNNSILAGYQTLYQPFFRVFLQYRREWNRIIGYLQKVSQPRERDAVSLMVEASREVKGEHGQRLQAPIQALQALEEIGMIRRLDLSGEMISFAFRDHQCRNWLRDVGSVLELYVYDCCIATGLFADVRTSVVVDWEGDGRKDNVTNEIDVFAVSGIRPVFISCKACDVKTESLNELAILRDRFGNGLARAAIVTTERGRGIMRRRAEELDILVIDLDDIQQGEMSACLAKLTK